MTLEILLGNRQGFRADLSELVENSPQVHSKKGLKTRDLIVNHLGFGSGYTYRKLKKILQGSCCAELIYSACHNKISLSQATELASLPIDQQLIHLSKII